MYFKIKVKGYHQQCFEIFGAKNVTVNCYENDRQGELLQYFIIMIFAYYISSGYKYNLGIYCHSYKHC